MFVTYSLVVKTGAVERMPAQQRWEQLLELAAEEFAVAGLPGVSTEALARRAAITGRTCSGCFVTKKAFFLQVVRRAFGRLIRDAPCRGGAEFGPQLARGDGPVPRPCRPDRASRAVAGIRCLRGPRGPRRGASAHGADVGCGAATTEHAALPRVAVKKTFLPYGMLLNVTAALGVDEVDAEWARGIRTRIHAGLFDHLSEENNQ
jgi:AcrR family transcriptional regulator